MAPREFDKIQFLDTHGLYLYAQAVRGLAAPTTLAIHTVQAHPSSVIDERELAVLQPGSTHSIRQAGDEDLQLLIMYKRDP
ncbi:hypothetical protein CSC74_11020 [Pseudoxanthomonas yeongjuensis]|nr:hypothetical protein CSC74_11020 [Pseudoxanthomonas yeongjuensis]